MSNRSHGWAFKLGAAMVGLVVGILIWGNQRVDGKKITPDVSEHEQRGIDSPTGVLVNGKQIIPGKVTSMLGVDPSGRPNRINIQGDFMVSSSTPGIASDGTGGACLVADLNPDLPHMPSALGRKCQKNSDCQGVPQEKGWAGYCDTKGTEGGPKNTCWVRPGPQSKNLCNLSLFPTLADPPAPATVWPEDIWHSSNLPFDVSKPITMNGASRRIYRWRVLACLNGAEKVLDPDSKTAEYKKACAVTDAPPNTRMEIFGPIKTIARNMRPLPVRPKALPTERPPTAPPAPPKSGQSNPR